MSLVQQLRVPSSRTIPCTLAGRRYTHARLLPAFEMHIPPLFSEYASITKVGLVGVMAAIVNGPTVVCAWCNLTLFSGSNLISHGICGACSRELLAAIPPRSAPVAASPRHSPSADLTRALL
jgi:hypothetical protein